MSNKSAQLTTNQPPFSANEWWMEVTKAIGVSECADIFSVDQRTVYRWRADGLSAERSTSVMEKFRHLLSMLIMFDRCDLAAAAVEYFNSLLLDAAAGIGVVPLAKTIHEEVSRDFISVGTLAAAIAEQQPVAVVKIRAVAAIEEINRSVAKYRRDGSGGADK